MNNDNQIPPSAVASQAAASAASSQSRDVVDGGSRVTSHGSTVMTETLSVIDEHITDLRQPSVSSETGDRRMVNDSGSEYSSQEHRLSYVAGSDSGNEDEGRLTETEVASWTPDRVAAYLLDAGVEKAHCDVFQEQEFSGEVLLGMDQSSIFLKELDLGPIGRRLKTWQKIKSLQEEAKNAPPTPKSSGTLRLSSGGASAAMSSVSQVVQQDAITVRGESPRSGGAQSTNGAVLPLTDALPSAPFHNSRPSAASVRSLGHNRRQSSIDGTPSMPPSAAAAFLNQQGHNKQPSFDRGWTMGGATSKAPPSLRPSSSHFSSRPASSHIQSMSSDRAHFENRNSLAGPDTERDAGSGGELDIRRQRNVAKAGGHANHLRQSSYGSERPLSNSIFRRSRPTSVNENTSTAAMTPSDQSGSRVFSEPTRDGVSPIVTKLEYDSTTNRKRISGVPGDATPDRSSNVSGLVGNRTVSDAVTGRERALITIPVEELPKPLPSPSIGGSSTPSIDSKGYSFDGSQNKPVTVLPGPGAAGQATRRKTKKETSAYTRGLEKKTPQEQRIGCEYSGWMKKRSSNLLTAWKPRLFILKGRRLSYYYSENDTEEKGLIDISNHRVLPADNERLTGLHASLTGGSTPTSPQMMSSSFSPRTTSSGASPTSPFSNGISSSPKDGGNNTFIFKLVPPRTGLSKAVNFTKPTVHYFAVPNLDEGRRWMAALMKATIDKDDTKGVTTTYQHKTISLEKARARKERPPALMHVDEEDAAGGTAHSAAFSPDGSSPDRGSHSYEEEPQSAGAQSIESKFRVPQTANSTLQPRQSELAYREPSPEGHRGGLQGGSFGRGDSHTPVSPISQTSAAQFYPENRIAGAGERETVGYRALQNPHNGGYSPRASSIQRSSAGGSTYGLGIEGLSNGSPVVENTGGR